MTRAWFANPINTYCIADNFFVVFVNIFAIIMIFPDHDEGVHHDILLRGIYYVQQWTSDDDEFSRQQKKLSLLFITLHSLHYSKRKGLHVGIIIK